MSETLAELLKRAGFHAVEANLRLSGLHDILDALIIHPAPDAKPYIVTRDVLEAITEAIDEATCHRIAAIGEQMCALSQKELRSAAEAALTALGPFVVADEVVEVVSPAPEPEPPDAVREAAIKARDFLRATFGPNSECGPVIGELDAALDADA